MVYIVFATFIGLGLGFLSYFYQKFFLGGLFSLCVGLGIFMRPFVFLAPAVGAEVSETGRSEGPIRDTLNVISTAFDMLPSGVQTALIVLPLAIFFGRLLSWAHYVCFPDHALPRTEAEHRLNTMNKFSLKRPHN